MTDAAPARLERRVTFSLPFVLDGINARLRTHWAARSAADGLLAQEIMAALGGPRYYPRPPFRRAKIEILRIGKKLLDPDGLAVCHKPLIDALCERCDRHPTGLGIIEDDSARHVVLDVKQMVSIAVPIGTCVTVTELPDLPPKRTPFRRQHRKPQVTAAQRKFARAYEALGRKF